MEKLFFEITLLVRLQELRIRSYQRSIFFTTLLHPLSSRTTKLPILSSFEKTLELIPKFPRHTRGRTGACRRHSSCRGLELCCSTTQNSILYFSTAASFHMNSNKFCSLCNITMHCLFLMESFILG